MNLLVGLGNPGDEYANNRHNVGFIFVDYLLRKPEIASSLQNPVQPWKRDQVFQSELAKGALFGTDYIFAKPQTFMNNSGIAVAKIARSFSIQLSDILVVHDDLDIPFSKLKIQFGSGPKIHNGISSIQHYLGSNEFGKIRIGVDNRNMNTRMPGEQYVLQDFTSDERQQLPGIFERIIEQLKTIHS